MEFYEMLFTPLEILNNDTFTIEHNILFRSG